MARPVVWEIRNDTPFAAAGTLLRDREGAESWVVAVRARFALAAGSDGAAGSEGAATALPRLLAPEPVRLAPVYDDDAAEELHAESDIAPFRPQVDVVLRGRAALPGAASSAGFEAVMEVGAVRRRFAVRRERWVRRQRGRFLIERGEPFETLDLTWREALGGRDPGTGAVCEANPIGTGWLQRWPDLPQGETLRLPRLEDPESPVAPDRPLPEPHAPGALQPHWLPRRRHAGTYDAAWRRDRFPLLPNDFDDAFHQAAPVAQRARLRGGEPVRLHNLSPGGPIALRLPQIVLEAQTRIGHERIDHRPHLVGVEIDTRELTLGMVWNAHVGCNGRDMAVEGSRLRVRQMAGVAT